ncbi:MAG: iron-containing redox enzyme family protein [Leptospiraceae bacterium]|nr:iron-containing redox enzyme family protein [Leptospiraceae bacterium]MCP5501443.1 iron-containing redox enzyme family protein [Leptospiraceae bacterium]
MNITERLKQDVQQHPVLQNNKWLEEKSSLLSKQDLLLWLSQEYFVSVGFVNWFLWTAAISPSQEAQMILVKNIWEELGEGNIEETHVNILKSFLSSMKIPIESLKLFPETAEYLGMMKEITNTNFYEALGALGPANEYLLKLEYSKVYEAYLKLREKENVPEARFFKVNLEADESHSAQMFRLIEAVADTEEKQKSVLEGNIKALNARILFYEGLMARTQF